MLRKTFETELQQVKDSVLMLGSMVEQAILESVEALDHFQAALARFRSVFRVNARVAVRDLHPGYLSTRLAEESGCERVLAVQHHGRNPEAA